MSSLSGLPASNLLAIRLGKLQQRTDNPFPAEQAERKVLSLEISKAYRREIKNAEDRGRKRPKHPLLIDVDDYILREGEYVHRDLKNRVQAAETSADDSAVAQLASALPKNAHESTSLPSFQRSGGSGSNKRKREQDYASSLGEDGKTGSTPDLSSNLAAGREKLLRSRGSNTDIADSGTKHSASIAQHPAVGHPAIHDFKGQRPKPPLTERRRQKERTIRNQQRRGVAVPVPKGRRKGFRDLKDDNDAYKGPRGLVDLGTDVDEIVINNWR